MIEKYELRKDENACGSVMGFTGVRDAKLYVKSVSGTIDSDTPKVRQISNYNVWLARKILEKKASDS